MRKFQFTLETLLKVRKEIENVARKNLFEMHIFLQKQNALLQSLKSKEDAIQKDVRFYTASEINTDHVLALYSYLERIKQNILVCKKIIVEAEASLAICRANVLTAMTKRKAIESYKEKRFTEWLYEFSEEEKSFLDELATVNYAKKNFRKGKTSNE